MTIATRTIQYQFGTAPVTGCGLPVRVPTQTGFSYFADELDTALIGSVEGVVYGDFGKADIKALLAGLAETDFENGN